MRTFAMRLIGPAYGLILATFVFFLVTFILPTAATDPQAAGFIPVFVVFMAAFGALGVASMAWSGALRRSWFWLVVAATGVLVILMFSPQLAFALTHPADPSSFVPTLLATTSALVLMAAGVVAFREVRLGAAAWQASGRAGLVALSLTGLVVGAVITSILAGGANGGGAGIAEAPTTTATVTAQSTKFLETSLSMKNGDVLGIFVVNKDAFAHTFDIDALNIHAQVPANATTFVAVKPTAPGNLAFYCAVPGHREAGMTGTITVQ